MFESVIEQRGLRSGRFGTGAWVSIGVHAGLLGLVVFISGRVPETVELPEPVVTFRQPAIRKGVKQATQPTQAATTAPVKPPKRIDRIPRVPPPMTTTPPEVTPDPTPEPTTVADATNTGETGTGSNEPVGDPDGDPNSTSPIGAIGVPNIPQATGTEVLPFLGGMTPPVMVSGAELSYTRQAQLAGVEGVVVAKCVITVEGTMRDCRIIKGLPYMDDAVLSALQSRRYQPMTYQGRPVNVAYTFNIKLRMPR
ncbi:energy transducer TonB [Corallococcus sp. CA053C]|uniref:energy transducer TonB n=1 Tax=Corallococcus sp. CA053C TaxID=2316732 RepID=UPI000EA25556|nr:energy transducer TonB [Corallococcus sp. CA053C]RKH08647.1 energy transducer TonB [Corallococcus sp. CA053C]